MLLTLAYSRVASLFVSRLFSFRDFSYSRSEFILVFDPDVSVFLFRVYSNFNPDVLVIPI